MSFLARLAAPTVRAAPSVGSGSFSRSLAVQRCACSPAQRYGVRAVHTPPPKPPPATAYWKQQKGTIAAAIAVGLLAGGLVYMQRHSDRKAEEERAARKRAVLEQTSFGRPSLGGPFELVMATYDPETKQPVGRRVSHRDLLGRFALIYFGFTNCPDICPEELDKMTSIVNSVENRFGEVIQPVFISCDPWRDTIPKTAEYAADYHPKMLGLTGHWDDIKAVCKAYRVYFSTPPSADPNSDYLVDHSIFFYLMDPEGRFVEVFGRSHELEETKFKVVQYIKQWKEAKLPLEKGNIKPDLIKDKKREITSLDKPLLTA